MVRLYRHLVIGSVVLAATLDQSRAGEVASRDLARCGPLALQVCSAMCGRPLNPEDVDSRIALGADGCTLLDLSKAAESLGLRTMVVRWSGSLPTRIGAPAVIPVVNRNNRRHFVVLAGSRDGEALIVDAPSMPAWMTIARLQTELHWGGEAMHVSCDDEGLAPVKDALVATQHRTTAVWYFASASAAVAVACAIWMSSRICNRGRSGPLALY
jgi:ABC-type bacteriocin/lantibiotic exporter with double-glycine peptidase domain